MIIVFLFSELIRAGIFTKIILDAISVNMRSYIESSLAVPGYLYTVKGAFLCQADACRLVLLHCMAITACYSLNLKLKLKQNRSSSNRYFDSSSGPQLLEPIPLCL
jgi:hypothetical protein